MAVWQDRALLCRRQRGKEVFSASAFLERPVLLLSAEQGSSVRRRDLKVEIMQPADDSGSSAAQVIPMVLEAGHFLISDSMSPPHLCLPGSEEELVCVFRYEAACWN